MRTRLWSTDVSASGRVRGPGPGDGGNGNVGRAGLSGATLGGAGRWMVGVRGGALLVVIWLAVYVPGLAGGMGPVDRDESRFAQASRQMFESVALPGAERDLRPIEPAPGGGGAVGGLHAGGLAVPMVGERARLNKPPMIYWLQSASAAVLTRGEPARDAIWMYRVPSALGALAAVLLTWRLGRRMFEPRTAWWGAAMLAVAPVVVVDMHQARADQVLLAATTASMMLLWRVWDDARRGREVGLATVLALWACVGAGVLTKGPITPMIVLLTVLALGAVTGRWRWTRALRPGAGLVVLIAMVAPWVWAVAAQVGWANYLGIIFDETLGRSAAPKEGHWGPPGYHLVLLAVLFWPGAMLTAAGLARAARRAMPGAGAAGRPTGRVRNLFMRIRSASRGRPAEVFCLCWIVPSWIVFELISTKLPHYTLPLYPAIALVSARALWSAAAGSLPGALAGAGRIGLALWIGIGAAALLGVGALGILAERAGGGISLAGAAAAAGLALAAGVFVVASRRLLRAGGVVRAMGVGLGASVVLASAAMGVALPGAVRITPGLTSALQTADPAGARPIAAVEYHEDSLMFAARGRLVRLDEPALAGWWASNPRGLMVLPERLVTPEARVLGRASGFNYAAGRMERLALVERADAAAGAAR